MVNILRADDRGHTHIGWLKSWHSFSFGEYYDPARMHFRALRVINDDYVAPGGGFPTHPHRNMEIVTYVLAGALEHKDSLGSGEVLRPGELQRMSAGRGIRHSEFNPSRSEPVHLYQIWLTPAREGLEPSYEQKSLPAEGRRGRWQLAASPTPREGALLIQTDAQIQLASLRAGESVSHTPASGRAWWLQALRGGVTVNGQRLGAGDAAYSESGEPLTVAHTGDAEAEVMLFDLA